MQKELGRGKSVQRAQVDCVLSAHRVRVSARRAWERGTERGDECPSKGTRSRAGGWSHRQIVAAAGAERLVECAEYAGGGTCTASRWVWVERCKGKERTQLFEPRSKLCFSHRGETHTLCTRWCGSVVVVK